jgi:uncharacterized protein (UPF0333 family)
MKKNKGQIAIEYIILISILLLFFQSIIYPNINFSENVVKDVYNITQTKQSLEKLGDDLSSFSSTPGYGKRIVYFYLPSSSQITDCNNTNNYITYEIRVSDQEPKPNIEACDRTTNICTFYKSLSIGSATDITCDNIGPGFNGYLIIEKKQNGDLNVSVQ